MESGQKKKLPKWERKLAILDANEQVKADDIRVKVIKNYLDSLSIFYEESTDTIAEYTSKCIGVFKDKGIRLKSIPFLKSLLVFSNLTGQQNTDFKDAIMVYGVFLEKFENGDYDEKMKDAAYNDQ